MLLPILLALAGSPTAEAKNNQGPIMWGVGPVVSTIALPARYPMSLPADADGKVNEVRGDVGIGIRGQAYLDRTWRGAARLKLGMGGGTWRDTQFILEVDKKLVGSNGFRLLGGGGLGFGTQKFTSDTSSAELSIGTLIARAQVVGQYRTKKSAYELGFFLVYPHPLIQEYVGGAGNTSEITGGFYPQFGLEGAVYFGDFKHPKKKGNNKGGNTNRKR